MLKESLSEHQDYCIEKNLEIDQKSTNLYKICGELNHWRHHTTTEKFGRLDEFLNSFGADFVKTLNQVNFMEQDKIGKDEYSKFSAKYQRLFQDMEDHMLEQRDNQKTLEHYCEIYIPIQMQNMIIDNLQLVVPPEDFKVLKTAEGGFDKRMQK